MKNFSKRLKIFEGEERTGPLSFFEKKNHATGPSKILRIEIPNKVRNQSYFVIPGVREKPEPEQTIVVEEENCPESGSRLEEPREVESRVIEDIPEPEPVVAKKYRIGHYECGDCGEEVVASHPDCPEEGRFGKNVLIQATLLKYEERIPYRKVSDLFEWQYSLEVSPASVLDFVRRTSDWLFPGDIYNI
ncbi:hypothetical protein AKJ41_05255 [candidate division MSBL1 archaeon SCGC-AAA259O05]|uniref:Transposase IS66 zinc-finger binding domain-containing protein n=1 Tax=candidate division MSBL1 archaeon SCGC-AAA259O05 TaxID=1698271 RepID=A0A133UZE8_9EURY|nr:hypothetical protein AKJ41_05255 [candidate division MSBL1 archaeon SCGC-AAA259O05]